VAAAEAFLGALDEEGRAGAVYPFDSAQRANWSNLPSGIFQRAGARLGDLTSEQHDFAMAVLSAAFSEDGYQMVQDVMQGDQMLLEPPQGQGRGRGGRGGRGGGGVVFGADEYYLAFVGTPSASERWVLQFGGHHLAVNLTLVGSRATLAPSHTGAQPAEFTVETRTVRPLGEEVDLAFTLMSSLNAAQREQAVLDYDVADLVLGPGATGRTIEPEGLRASELNGEQQAILLDLANEWAGIAAATFAESRMDELRQNIADTWFAWSGPTTEGSAAYFRVQGPTLLIEYAPQGGVDHIHTIYRDPTNEYGDAYVTP
jgi:hypothetical protein